jgi:D-alanine-D-alanine ligase
VEAVPNEEGFYDFESRYEIGRTTFVCPAELPEAVAERASALAVEVFALLGCSGFARVDLMLDPQLGELYVLEADSIPGLTETSLLPQAVDAAGVSFDELVQLIIDAAMAQS